MFINIIHKNYINIYILIFITFISCQTTKNINKEDDCSTIELFNSVDVILLGHQFSAHSIDMYYDYVTFLIDTVYKGPISLKTAVEKRRNKVFEKIEGVVYAEPLFGNKERIQYVIYRNPYPNNNIEYKSLRNEPEQEILFFNFNNQDSINWNSSLKLIKRCKAKIKTKLYLQNSCDKNNLIK